MLKLIIFFSLVAYVVYLFQTVPLVGVSERKVPIGMSRHEVMALMQGSTKEFQTFPWCDQIPKECEEARRSNAVKFVSLKGYNAVFVVGFDAHEIVRYRKALVHPWSQ